MAKHGQQPADGGDDSSCPRSQPNQSRSDHGDESRGTSSVFPSHQTRPLFGSLEEAHNRITRPQPSGTSTSVTDDTASSGSGDDFILKDMRRLSPVDARAIYTNVGYPVTRAFSRSVTDGINRTVDGQALVPSPLLVQKQLDPDPRKNGEFASPPTSKTAPVAWQELGEPWKIPPTRFPEAQAFAEANTSNQPPPYSPKSELERTIGYHDPAAEGSFAVESTPQPGLAPSPGGNRCAQQHEAITMLGRAAEEEIRSPPQIALPEDPPFHPSNPFAASARLTASQTVLRVISVSPSPESPFPNQPLHLSDSQDDRARIGGDLGVASGVGYDSEPGVGSGESKVPKMLRPPARMHSARRKERSRQSLVSSSRSSVIGGGVTEGSEDDPFHYDSVFLRPSREREVSAYLHRVSGVERGSTAIICSPDGSPLRTSRHFMDKRPHSPEVQPMALDSQVSSLRLPQHAAVGNDAQNKQEQHFFEPGAIDPGWTVGSPDVVRVPVRGRVQSYQRRSTGEKHPDAEVTNLVLEGLRGCEEQNRLPTGNTEG
jgi:hypothetical protein